MILPSALDCRYHLQLSAVQVLVDCGSDQWRSVLGKRQSRLHLLDQVNLSVWIDRWVCYARLNTPLSHDSATLSLGNTNPRPVFLVLPCRQNYLSSTFMLMRRRWAGLQLSHDCLMVITLSSGARSHFLCQGHYLSSDAHHITPRAL